MAVAMPLPLAVTVIEVTPDPPAVDEAGPAGVHREGEGHGRAGALVAGDGCRDEARLARRNRGGRRGYRDRQIPVVGVVPAERVMFTALLESFAPISSAMTESKTSLVAKLLPAR